MNIYKKTELLSPAGSYEGLKLAIEAGADAVYLGGRKFGARAYANNFDTQELLSAIDYVHLRNRKLYLTVNTLMKEKEMRNELFSYLYPLYQNGLDAVIVQDIGIVEFIRQTFPELPVHASTQMTVTALPGVEFLHDLGITRVVTARELSLRELKYITSNTEVEIEAFIHGAMCCSYSGQCLMSSILGGRSGNRGRCAQPCRLQYTDDRGHKTAALSLKDMCTYPILNDLMTSGIASFKIEGRMKSPEYTAGVTSIYRYRMDIIEAAIRDGVNISNIPDDTRDLEALNKLYSRGSSGTGYYLIQNGPAMLTGKESGYTSNRNAADYRVREHCVSLTGKNKINGELYLYPDSPMRLIIHSGSCITETTGDMVSKAINAPLTVCDVDNRIRKTGGTSYEFDKLDIHMGDNIYCPVKSLNELRRKALEALDERLISTYRRDITGITDPFVNLSEKCNDIHKKPYSATDTFLNTASFKPGNIYVSALVNTKEQLKSACNFDKVRRIYLERRLWDLAAEIKDREVILCLPHIMREATVREFTDKWNSKYKNLFNASDGVMIRNLEGYRFLYDIGYTGAIITDSNLYTWNRFSVEFWKSRGIKMTTIPYELKAGEIRGRSTDNSEMIVYGRIPLMITAQCIQKNLYGCVGGNDCLHSGAELSDNNHARTAKPAGKPFGIRYLSDRYNKVFPVYNRCSECYNILYNSLPLYLVDESDKLIQDGIRAFRYEFTIENEKETTDVLNGIPPVVRTRGHYSRGVE